MQTENSMSEPGYPVNYPTVSRLEHNPDVKLVYAAVLFADIKGFTRFCQSVDLSTAFHTLSVFHQRMARVISSYAQTVTSNAGDEVMAAWCGEPSLVTTKALRCGFTMIETMSAWNSEDVSSRQALKIGIGVHAGPVILGRIPGESRMSVFGDTVNTASRLEQMTRAYSTDLIASDEMVRTAYSHTRSEVGPSRFCPSVTIKVRDRAGSLPIRIAV